MGKITYTNLKLKTNDEVKTIDFNGNQIEVKQYLPIEDKIDLINISLQMAKENGIYNLIKLNMYFNLYIVYLYTNISFTDKQREDEYKLYNTLLSTGLVETIRKAIPENENMILENYLNRQLTCNLEYKNSFAGIISNIINDLPERAEEMQSIIENFDKEKFTNVLEFAKAANGGRDI